jgi:hypothetical protein
MLVYAFALLLILPVTIEARKTSGSFVLSGVNSEYVLGSFALSAYARGWIDITLASKDMYDHERSLKLHFFLDNDWSKFKKAQTCSDRIKLARQTMDISFEYVRKPTDQWKAMVATHIDQTKEKRPHYWYFVIADCSLEYQYRDGSIPKLDFTLQIWNDISGQREKQKNLTSLNKRSQLTHLSADQTGSKVIHYITMFLSGFLALSLGFLIFYRMVETQSVHLALFIVMAAAGCDSSSSFCEIVHLRAYEHNGYGWYFMDAMSAHLEAMCDSLVAILLLAIASGWTLPSDMVPASAVQTTWMQSLTQGLRNPISALVKFDRAGILALSIVLVHLILAQWGRIYNDDFDSYHDFEHFPGRVLMGFRIVLGLMLVGAALQTKSSCPHSLAHFYTFLAVVGTLWFQGLPIVTWVCGWAMPYYLRHPAITTYGAVCQTVALLLLAWLVTAHSNSSFHRLSRMQQGKESNLTDSLASAPSSSSGGAPTQWKIGKAKVRLD